MGAAVIIQTDERKYLAPTERGFERYPVKSIVAEAAAAYEAFVTDATGGRAAYREFVS